MMKFLSQICTHTVHHVYVIDEIIQDNFKLYISIIQIGSVTRQWNIGKYPPEIQITEQL